MYHYGGFATKKRMRWECGGRKCTTMVVLQPKNPPTNKKPCQQIKMSENVPKPIQNTHTYRKIQNPQKSWYPVVPGVLLQKSVHV